MWTDACGLVLLTSLYRATRDRDYLSEAQWLVADVDRVLGRKKGIRIGEEPDRDGQYYHYLAMWMYALACLGEEMPQYRAAGIQLARAIHPAFHVAGSGIIWKMKEDLSGPYPGYGLGGLDPYHGLLAYTRLDPEGKQLGAEINDMRVLVEGSYRRLDCSQDLGLGILLWAASFFPGEQWAQSITARSTKTLDSMWQAAKPAPHQPQQQQQGDGADQAASAVGEGYFCRHPWLPQVRLAFSNYGASLGCQAADLWTDRIHALNRYFEHYRSGDEYDEKAITWVMACNSHFPGAFMPRPNYRQQPGDGGDGGAKQVQATAAGQGSCGSASGQPPPAASSASASAAPHLM